MANPKVELTFEEARRLRNKLVDLLIGGRTVIAAKPVLYGSLLEVVNEMNKAFGLCSGCNFKYHRCDLPAGHDKDLTNTDDFHETDGEIWR